MLPACVLGWLVMPCLVLPSTPLPLSALIFTWLYWLTRKTCFSRLSACFSCLSCLVCLSVCVCVVCTRAYVEQRGPDRYVPPKLSAKNTADKDKYIGDRNMRRELAHLTQHVVFPPCPLSASALQRVFICTVAAKRMRGAVRVSLANTHLPNT